MPDTWRTVELTSQQTLRDLHVAIQEALDWEPDNDMAFFVGENPLEDGDQFTLDDSWDDEDDEEDDWDDEDEDDEDEDDEDEDDEDDEEDELDAMLAELPPLDLGGAARPESMEDALALMESNPEVRAQVRQMLIEQMGVPGFMADMMLGSLRSLMEMLPEEMLAGLTGGDGPEAKDASTATLEALELAPGQRMLYMFGDDDWRFDVRVEAINEEAEDDAFYPLILDGDGPAPQQYFDDEEDDDGRFDWIWEELEEEEDEFEEEE